VSEGFKNGYWYPACPDNKKVIIKLAESVRKNFLVTFIINSFLKIQEKIIKNFYFKIAPFPNPFSLRNKGYRYIMKIIRECRKSIVLTTESTEVEQSSRGGLLFYKHYASIRLQTFRTNGVQSVL